MRYHLVVDEPKVNSYCWVCESTCRCLYSVYNEMMMLSCIGCDVCMEYTQDIVYDYWLEIISDHHKYTICSYGMMVKWSLRGATAYPESIKI